MRLRVSRQGFWLAQQKGAWRLHSWTSVLPFLLLPVAFLFFAVLALNRESFFLRSLKFAISKPEHELDGPLSILADSNQTSLENSFFLQPAPTESELTTLHLLVSKNTLRDMQTAKLTGNPKLGHDEGGDTPYFKALYRDESGVLQTAKIAYRGTFGWHHWPVKPSLRVKIRKEEVALGRRYVELSRPKDVLTLRHRLPEILCRDLGLMTARSDVVRLFINRKYFGIYQRSYRPGEPLALAFGRMPGTFFKGDAIQERRHLDLWESVEHWSQFGEAVPEDAAFFSGFLANLREPSSRAGLEQLATLVDLEIYARWAAVMSFTGCIHTDQYHNHMYFFCTNQGKLEAMPWDPTCYETENGPLAPIDMVRHPLMRRLLCDPRFVHRRNQWLHRLLHEHGSEQELDARLRDRVAQMLPDLSADGHLSDLQFGSHRVPSSVLQIEDHLEDLLAWLKVKRGSIEQYLHRAEVAVAVDPEDPGACLVDVFGSVAIRASRRDGQPLEAEGRVADVLLLYPGFQEELGAAPFSLGGKSMPIDYAQPAALRYRLRVPREQLQLHNALTTELVDPGHELRDPAGRLCSVHPWDFPEPLSTTVELGPGVVEISEDLQVQATQELVVHPGTTLRLSAGVGIYSRGRTLMQGRADAPIVVEPADPEPWGTVGVSGSQSAGTRLEHVRFRGGSIGSADHLRFKGMVCVYDCPDVQVKNCEFGANLIGDDTLNLAESRILVEDCVFRDALSDAFDADRCEGTIRGCRFYASGNDALDLMTCRVQVEDCRMEGSGDKGISVGEGTRALVRDCELVSCTIGIELKDSSRAVVYDTLLTANTTAVHAYQKKWNYPGGGSALFVRCRFSENPQDFDLKKRCHVQLWETVARPGERVEQVDGVDAWFQEVLEVAP